MKFIDEYRDPALVQGLVRGIQQRAARIGSQVTIMEVCGSHTQAIGRYGIRALLPNTIRLISGPGCPVCVTSGADVDRALHLARQSGVLFATFGDMLRVPGTGGASLQQLRAAGADIRVVSSAADCLELARTHPSREIVFMGIGFETTSPTVAAMVAACYERGIQNVSVFSVHKLIPPALQTLINDPALSIDGFLCPGHVSTIIGVEAYACIPAAGRAAVITGFEPVDILEGIFLVLGQILDGNKEVTLQYRRAVSPEGNKRAQSLLEKVFYPSPAEWRGLGRLPASGLAFTEAYQAFDACKRFPIPEMVAEEAVGCRCGDVLRGICSPLQCPLFGSRCSPAHPVGPCMVSTEGTCAAYYKYR
ncbi:MAG: hydrogenase formation protein HypD [Desulfobacterota bacterium]|nr:hydrogenase formation protein HypD [Thermodesulfobacteriota bacterium]